MRNARNFDNVANSSASAASRNAMRARASPSGVPDLFKQTQQGHCSRQREGELLRRASASRMDSARVGDQERPSETLASQRERGLDTGFRLSAPVGWKRSAGRGRERVEAERDCAVLRSCARALDQSGEPKRLIGAVGPKIEFEIRARIETHAIEGLVQRGGVEASKAKTIGAERARGHDLQAVGAIGQVVERLRVGLVGMGMIESAMIRQGPPGRNALGPSAGG